MRLPSLRECLWGLLIIFIIYAVLNDPTGSADFTHTAWGHIKDGADAVMTFFDGVIKS